MGAPGAALGARSGRAERSRSQPQRLAASFRWRKTLRPAFGRSIPHRRRRLPGLVTGFSFDCWAVAGQTPGLRAPGSPEGKPEKPAGAAGWFAKCLR